MDKRKLIGTIIGVTMFAALIAGATFAWLSFTANVYNSTYISNTMNFMVDYTKGTAIADIPIVRTGAPTSSGSSHLIVKAKKHSGSPDGFLAIKLSTTSNNTLTTGSIINWALCKGECSGNFSAAKATGIISVGGTTSNPNTIVLYDEYAAYRETDAYKTSGESADDSNYKIATTDTSYYVYFWIDASKITNSHINQQYNGYIHASAAQKET